MWGAHLLAVAAIVAAGGLGTWQLDAWRAHRAAEARDLTSAAPVALTKVIGPDDPFPGDSVGQPVRISGTWLPGGTIYISDREHDGTKGYWAVTPIAVGGGSKPAIEVVRGWVRQVAQAPAPPQGPAAVTGWLQPAEGTRAVDDDPDDDVLPQLRLADAIQHVQQDLYGAYVVADEGLAATDTAPGSRLEPATLEQLPPAGAFTALRNLLYAVEWWLFGAFAAFIWWRYVRDVIDAGEAGDAGEAVEQTAEQDQGADEGSVTGSGAADQASAEAEQDHRVPSGP